ALRLVNADGDVVFAKFRWKSHQGIRNLTAAEAAAADFNYATKDLYDNIGAGNFPKWDLHVQILKPEDIEALDFNPFDATKIWPGVEEIKVGTMTLNRVPDNFFQASELSAFAPGVMVPGIEASPDRLLQGRLFSYADTQRYRIGANYQSLPINMPKVPVRNSNQDGKMSFIPQSGEVNYQPSRKTNDNVFVDDNTRRQSRYALEGLTQQLAIKKTQPFKQAGDAYRGFTPEERTNLIANLAGDLGQVRDQETKEIMVSHFYAADREFGERLAEAVAVDVERIRQASLQ
ncbi:MAG: catalase, partial [Minwuiales bacterium]|nr:catalase [Minwuiales bacterium]